MTTLKSAQNNPAALEEFITKREPLDAPKEAVQRYIDASAKPLEKPSKGRSTSNSDFSADYT
mgnify:CR=1 FL=1